MNRYFVVTPQGLAHPCDPARLTGLLDRHEAERLQRDLQARSQSARIVIMVETTSGWRPVPLQG